MQPLWADLASCASLESLELKHTAWGLTFDISDCPFKLANLKVMSVQTRKPLQYIAVRYLLNMYSHFSLNNNAVS